MALYGLGSMLGAGIYGLIGKAAGQAGNAVWLAFVIALLAALLTALSYASLGSRYPRAAGAAYVTERAYGFPLLSFVVGLALVCSGLTSIATQSRVFAANLTDLLGTDSLQIAWLALGFLLVLTGIVFRGIRASMWINVLCTLVEAGGLVLVIVVGLFFWGTVDYLETPVTTGEDYAPLLIMQAAVLAFFAFIGFEDMYNVVEEVRHPELTLPLGLILAMAVAALLYIAVAVTAVRSAVARACRSTRAGYRNHYPRCAGDSAHRVHRHHTVRGQQHGARQLRHGLAPDLRHGPARASAGLTRQRSCIEAHAAHRHRCPVSYPRAACALGHDCRARGCDRPSPASRLHGCECGPLCAEAPKGRAAGAIRGAALRAGGGRDRVPCADRGQGRDR